jgi:hypothetical protein
MSKITLKNNKMMGGMTPGARRPPPPPSSTAVTSSTIKGTSLNAKLPSPPLTVPLPKAVVKAVETSITEQIFTDNPNINELLNSEKDVNGPLHTLLKTYKNRQLYNLINISYSNITAFLNILIVYLDNIGVIAFSNTLTEQPFKIQLKETLTTLLNNINDFKINHTPINNGLIKPINGQLGSIVYDNTKNPFSFYNEKGTFIGLFSPKEIKEQYFEEYNYQHIISDISNIINETNIIFTTLLSDSIPNIMPMIDSKTILENNIILLIYTQLISYKFFKEISTDNKILNISSQNTYKISKRLHEHLFKLLQEP